MVLDYFFAPNQSKFQPIVLSATHLHYFNASASCIEITWLWHLTVEVYKFINEINRDYLIQLFIFKMWADTIYEIPIANPFPLLIVHIMV